MTATLGALAPFLVLAIAACPWVAWGAARVGSAIAGATALAAACVLVLVGFTEGAVATIDPVLTTMGLAVAAFAAGLVLVIRSRPTRLPRRTLAVAAASGTGLVVWCIGLLVARVLPESDSESWAMIGDGANNVQIARGMLADSGYVPGTGVQVPLQSELLTLAMWPGRTMDGLGELLQHDAAALASFWALALGVTGVTIAAAVVSALRTARLLPTAIVAAVASLLTLTWFVSGLPVEWGYLNVHVALPLALAAWPAYLRSSEHPRAALVACLALAAVVLTSWSPLVVVPGALAVTIAIRHRELFGTWGWRRVLPLLLVSAAVGGVFFVVYVPAFVAGLGVLAVNGNGFPVLIGVVVGASVITIACSLLPGLDRVTRDGLRVTVAAGAAGIGVLVALGLPDPDVFENYYPAKLCWFVIVILVVTSASGAARSLVATLPARRIAFVAAPAAIVVFAAAAVLPPLDAPGYRAPSPWVRMLTGSVWNTGDDAVDLMADLEESESIALLWDSENPDEAMINYWVLDFRGSGVTGQPEARSVTAIAYRKFHDLGTTQPESEARLCTLGEYLDGPLVAYTDDPTLETRIDDKCDDLPITVVDGPVPDLVR